jgi:hypothetical protein
MIQLYCCAEDEARMVMALMPSMARGSSHFAFSVKRFMALIFIY